MHNSVRLGTSAGVRHCLHMMHYNSAVEIQIATKGDTPFDVWLSECLLAAFEELIEEPIPDEFLTIIESGFDRRN